MVENSTDTIIAKPEVPTGSSTARTQSLENISRIMQIVIDKATGKIKVVYAEEHHEPCVLCDNQASCDKSRFKECNVFCG